MYISPSVADSRPAMHRRVVVLPQPEGPRRTTNSLSFTSRSSPVTARVPSYDFVSPRNETRAKETLDGQERINNLRLPLLAVAPRMTDFHGSSSRRGETPVRLSRDYRGPGVRRDPRPREQVERKAGRARERDRIRRRRRRVAAQPRPLAAGCRSGRALVRPRRVERPRIYVNPPAMDPTSPKNRHVYREELETILPRFDIDFDRPVITQVGRFDPWKDPLGVIDAYRLVKKKVPRVQLLMVASMARDDPEGWMWFERSARHAGDDPDIHFLTDLRGVGALEVNVLQRQTDVSIAKSLREGFGLIVSESLWKSVPVVGGDVTGIRLQIKDGRHGYLVSSVRECADRTIELLRSPGKRKTMGKAGRERVRKHFLITRYLREYLRIFSDLAAGS